MMGAWVTGEQPKVRRCGICGLEHETGHHTSDNICVRSLKAQVDALTAQLADMTADRDSEQRWACEYFAETLKLQAQVATLTAERDAALAELSETEGCGGCNMLDEMTNEAVALEAERDEQRRVMLIMQDNNEKLAGENHALALRLVELEEYTHE